MEAKRGKRWIWRMADTDIPYTDTNGGSQLAGGEGNVGSAQWVFNIGEQGYRPPFAICSLCASRSRSRPCALRLVATIPYSCRYTIQPPGNPAWSQRISGSDAERRETG
eukprot:scaffold12924_cov125-Isochrysis_galbana.AAC.15